MASTDKITTTLSGGQKKIVNVNEEITTLNQDFETATELNECPSCTCECATDLSGSSGRPGGSVNTALPNAQSESEEKFIDLLDIYNQSDLDNGIFNEGMCSNPPLNPFYV